MTDPRDELQKLQDRIALRHLREGVAQSNRRVPKPIYVQNIDKPDSKAIVLVVRQDAYGGWTGKITLPQWHELPAGWDGPHGIDVAVKLADDYAQAYGYSAIAIDIESSQLWDAAWGDLMPSNPDLD